LEASQVEEQPFMSFALIIQVVYLDKIYLILVNKQDKVPNIWRIEHGNAHNFE